MLNKQIWLDDIHGPDKSDYPLTNPIWIKNGEDFISLLDGLAVSGDDKYIDMISFDNDLGDIDAITGSKCFDYLESYLHDGFFAHINTIVIHSDNTAAVGYMLGAKDTFEREYGISIIRKRRIFKD